MTTPNDAGRDFGTSDCSSAMTLEDAVRIRWETIQDLRNGVNPPRHANTMALYQATQRLALEFEKSELAQVIRHQIRVKQTPQS
jgi:hypothetical protein